VRLTGRKIAGEPGAMRVLDPSGMSTVSGLPLTSAAAYPNIRSAPGLK